MNILREEGDTTKDATVELRLRVLLRVLLRLPRLLAVRLDDERPESESLVDAGDGESSSSFSSSVQECASATCESGLGWGVFARE